MRKRRFAEAPMDDILKGVRPVGRFPRVLRKQSARPRSTSENRRTACLSEASANPSGSRVSSTDRLTILGAAQRLIALSLLVPPKPQEF
jgi:hypothetical protein